MHKGTNNGRLGKGRVYILTGPLDQPDEDLFGEEAMVLLGKCTKKPRTGDWGRGVYIDRTS